MEFKKLIKKIFNPLRNGDIKDEKEFSAIETATSETVKSRLSNFEKLRKIDRAYLEGENSLEEYLDTKKKNLGYETTINPQIETPILDKLIENNILKEGTKGLFLTEPFWNGVLNFIDLPNSNYPKKSVLTNVKKAIINLANNVDIVTPLDSRKKLTDEIGLYVGSEESLIFSNSPSIFNPFENEGLFLNHTRDFTKSLSQASKATYYIWDETSIISQISDNMKNWQGKKDDLMQKYFEWFKIFPKNSNIKIYWGDNSHFTKSDFSLPYISNSQMIIGVRQNKKLQGGVRISTSGIRSLVSLTPIVGKFASLSSEISNPILGLPSFSNLRQSLVDKYNFNTVCLSTEFEILRFIEYWFTKAEVCEIE